MEALIAQVTTLADGVRVNIKANCSGYGVILIHVSGRAVATPYLGMALVFMGFGCFQVS